MPKHLGMEGPVMSASSTATSLPRRRRLVASREVTRLLPTPPLPLTTPMTFFTWLKSLVFSKKLWGCCREGQFSPQLEQSWVQFSLIGRFILSHGPGAARGVFLYCTPFYKKVK